MTLASGNKTPVEVWGPAFRWMSKLTIESVFSSASPSRCNLCEQDVGHTERKRHVAEHVRELERYKRERRKQREREQTARLRQVAREKRLEKEVLGE